MKARPSVIVGGIGFPGRPNNEFALETFMALGINVSHDEMSLSYRSRVWESEVRNGMLVRDSGLFARVHSPIDPDVTLILVQGTHTRGVYGAAKAFSLSEQATHNHRLAASAVGDRDFVAIFDVDIVAGEVLVPQLNEQCFFAV
jgi:hypothetical protein